MDPNKKSPILSPIRSEYLQPTTLVVEIDCKSVLHASPTGYNIDMPGGGNDPYYTPGGGKEF